MTNDIETIQLDCGMTLVTERVPNVASAALSWLLPIGSSTDSDDCDGHSAMLSELLFRGAGGMSSREHSDALDRHGVQRSSRTTTHHLRIDATLLGDRLADALPLITMLVRDPAMPADAIDPVRSLCLQSLEALDDDPQHLAMLHLRERHLPPPFNRHGYGRRDVLETVGREDLCGSWAARCAPGTSIFAAAGAVDSGALAERLNALLSGWSGEASPPQETASAQRGYLHVEQDTAQVHIGLAYDAPREADHDSMLERLAVAVLSGSTSGRLFTEVRQKRSLCYSVSASYRAGRDRGLVALYAGTTPQRAQETLDVSIAQIERLSEGVRRDEFERAVVGLKSHLIMQGESTPARAAAISRDHFRLGRSRTLQEIGETIDAISLDALNAYLAERLFGGYTVASIGPEALRTPEA